jgi:hypothetical protein
MRYDGIMAAAIAASAVPLRGQVWLWCVCIFLAVGIVGVRLVVGIGGRRGRRSLGVHLADGGGCVVRLRGSEHQWHGRGLSGDGRRWRRGDTHDIGLAESSPQEGQD